VTNTPYVKRNVLLVVFPDRSVSTSQSAKSAT
jgi:hypothetical protein